MRVNIGAGITKIDGFVNVDIAPHADVVIDLGVDKLPFEDDSVDLVFTYHTLEHIPDYLHALSEIHRVLKHGAPLLVGLPYATLTEYHLVNPYHLHNFNEHSFAFFDPKRLLDSAAEQAQRPSPIFEEVFCDLHYMGRFRHLPETAKRYARRHLLNVVKKLDFGLLAVKSTDPLPPVDVDELRQRFRTCEASRRPY